MRTKSIAAKHMQEYSVDPFTGQYINGEAHAPLIYMEDPRLNLPSNLKTMLAKKLVGLDHLIVKGWIQAVTSSMDEDYGE